MSKIFKPRRGRKSTMNGTKASTVLSAGEFFVEVPDSGVGTGACRLKMGDGTTAYSKLPYMDSDPSESEVTVTADASTTTTAALGNVVTGKSLSSLLGSLKQAAELNRQAIAKLNDEIEDIKNPPFSATVGNTFSGTVSGSHTGTYNFRCIYTNGKDYYFLCLTNLGIVDWSIACSYSWTVTIQGKTVTAKIPTKAQVEVATQANRAIGFDYWTSTPYDSSRAWYVLSGGSLSGNYTGDIGNGAVPLAVINL